MAIPESINVSHIIICHNESMMCSSNLSKEEALEMLGEIRAHSLLDGVRGQPPVDKEAIVDVLLRVAQLVVDFPEILELDINPLMVYPAGQGAVAIDMRLVLSKDAHPD